MMPPYSPDQMSDQYNNGKRVPDYEQYLARWQERSAHARATLRMHADLAYGPAARERIDLFRPSGDAAAPLLIFIHGGYWQYLGKHDWSCVAEPYVGRGIAVAVVGYTLCPDTTVAGIAEELRAACAFLYLHADEYGLSRSYISVAGHSAGGHLAAMMLATDWPARDQRLPTRMFHAALALSGVFDLEPLTLTHLNQALRLSASEALSVSPIFMRKLCIGTPMLVIVGGAESPEFLRQSASMASAWADTTYREEAQCNHFSIVDGFHAPSAPLFALACDMLNPVATTNF